MVVTKCANPSCDASFRYFRGGRLYLLELPFLASSDGNDFQNTPGHSEYFWLCERCSAMCTMGVDREGHPRVVLRSSAGTAKGSARKCGATQM